MDAFKKPNISSYVPQDTDALSQVFIRWLSATFGQTRFALFKRKTIVSQSCVGVGLAVGTAEQILFQDTVTGGSFINNDDCLEIQVNGFFTDNVGHKIVRMKLGGVTILDTINSTFTKGNFEINVKVFNKGTAQQIISAGIKVSTEDNSHAYTAWTTYGPMVIRTAQVFDFTQDQLLQLTGTSTGGLVNDIIKDFASVQFMGAPFNAS